METERESLTHRYTRIITAFFKGIAAHNHALPQFVSPLFDKLITKPHIRALNLLCKLMAGVYRLPRKRTTKRAYVPKPPVFTPPDQPKTTGWMGLARILPTPMAPAVAACRAELQQFLSEPAMATLFEQAPALRRHLHPFCRALGVTLPGDPMPPPDPEPAPVPPPPPPEIGEFVHGRDPTPAWYRMPIIRPAKNAF